MWNGYEKFESVCKSQLKAFLHSLANIFLFVKNVKPFSLHGFKLMLGHFYISFSPFFVFLSYLFCFVNTSFDIDMKCQTFTNALVFLFCLFWFSTTDIVI